MDTTLAPICLFTYNRLDETKQTVEALQQNHLAPESELFIFSDGPKNEKAKSKIDEVRAFLKTIDGFKKVTIFEAEINKGLANSIIDGVTQIIQQYGKVIVLEDDLITAPNFLDFMNQALDFYNYDSNIQTVNGFSLSIDSNTNDVYFQIRPFPWGWATWSNRWDKQIFAKTDIKAKINDNPELLKSFKIKCGNDISNMLLGSISGVNDSWYVRWTFSHYINNKVSVYPKKSLVANIGFGTQGTHCIGVNTYIYSLWDKHKINFELFKFQKLDKQLVGEFLKYFTITHKIKVRIGYLFSSSGREILKLDIKEKFKKL